MLLLAAAVLWTAVHGVAGVRWLDVLGILTDLRWTQLALLTAVWLGGLGIYSFVLRAALPGLGIRRGLLLNLSGSAVANAVPLGGAAATALNWRMVRAWGHSDGAFATFCALTNALDVATKLVLPVIAVATMLAVSAHVPLALWALSLGCVAVLLLALVLHAVVVRQDASPRAGAGRWTRLRLLIAEYGVRMRAQFAQGWSQLVPASLGYVAAQVLLLYLALRSVGLDVPVTVVLAAAAIERLATLVPITPGGTGVAELGTIAWLVAAGLSPVQVVAGVLVYRVFLFAMEIPVGAVLLGAWAWLHRPGARARTSGVAA